MHLFIKFIPQLMRYFFHIEPYMRRTYWIKNGSIESNPAVYTLFRFPKSIGKLWMDTRVQLAVGTWLFTPGKPCFACVPCRTRRYTETYIYTQELLFAKVNAIYSRYTPVWVLIAENDEIKYIFHENKIRMLSWYKVE